MLRIDSQEFGQDTAALRAALDALHQAGGGELFISADVRIQTSQFGSAWVGAWVPSQTRIYGAPDAKLIVEGPGYGLVGRNNVHVDGLANEVLIERLSIWGEGQMESPASGALIGTPAGAIGWTVQDCRVQAPRSYGIAIDRARRCLVTRNRCDGSASQVGILITSQGTPGLCRDIIVTDNFCAGNRFAGINVEPDVDGFILSNNSCRSNGLGGIVCTSVSRGTIANNLLSHNGQSGLWIAENSHHLIATGNVIADNAAHGIYVSAAYADGSHLSLGPNLFANNPIDILVRAETGRKWSEVKVFGEGSVQKIGDVS